MGLYSQEENWTNFKKIRSSTRKFDEFQSFMQIGAFVKRIPARYDVYRLKA